MNVVAINTRSMNFTATGDYHIIPFSRIQNFQITALAAPESAGSPVGPVDLNRLQKREEARIRKLKEDKSDRGKGVTKEAQAIFDALKRVYVSPSCTKLLILGTVLTCTAISPSAGTMPK
jgi:hypothetical protein